jgi:uncharacterized protein YqeY
MSIVDDVSQQIKEAMRAREKVRVRALRGIRAAFIEVMKADGAETLGDDAAQQVLRKLAKARQESIVAFTKGGREELAAGEQAELDVIEAFLPQLADEATTRTWAQAAIEATGASSMRDMGKVMGQLKKEHGALLDGRIASGVVKALLSA